MANYNVQVSGAIGDGVVNDAPAFQKAIDVCTESDREVVPAGITYMYRTSFLKSNVHLRMEPGAIVIGGTHKELSDSGNWRTLNTLWELRISPSLALPE
ncbi:MAG: hypothetical protein MUQ10_03130 [Anaerolineae bacterium]|nr:hypothetical protein [Anaerolineae bacterium]